jgi:hypothetical protein
MIRTNAAFILSKCGNAQVLLKIAKNTLDSQVKIWVFNGLVFNADKTITEVMVISLSDTNPNVRVAALCGLSLSAREFIPRELPALVKCLQDADPTMRCSAAMFFVSYQYAGLANPTEDEVRSAACLEIKKATASSNTYISNAANIALKQFDQYDVLPAYSRELWLSTQEIIGTNWTARLRVVDENNKPVADANASVEIYIHDLDLFGHVVDRTEEIKGKTDANGFFTASRKGFCPSAFNVAKNGYTPVRLEHDMVSFKDDDPRKWHPSMTVVLKKKEHP